MGWLSGWNYRKSHEIEGSNAGAQSNYQIKIIVHKGTGIDSEEHVYCNNHCRDDFGDIRFTKSDGETLLDYWIEEYTSGDKATFWVEVDSIPASPDKATIYIYYGKSDATTTSNGKDTFPIFYDFNTDESNEWILDVGQWVWDIANGVLRLKGAGETRVRVAGATVGFKAFRTRCKARFTGESGTGDTPTGILFGYQDGNNFYMARIHQLLNEVQLYKKVNGSFSKIGYASTTINDNQYYVLSVKWISASHVKVYLDDVEVIDQTANLQSWTSGGIGLRAFNDEGVHDWFLVRKCVDPEPTHGSWGSEEQSGATEITVTDSISLSDSVLRHKTLSISDSIGVSDQIFGHKIFSISDIIQLLDQIIRNKSFTITDQINLSDQILRNKTLSITDIIQLFDQIIRDKSLTISDQINLSDQTLCDKSLAISDSITLSDLVNVIKEIIKTVFDNVSLSDSAFRHKVFAVLDNVSLLEEILRHKSLLIQDSVTLTENVLRNKILEIQDQISLLESVITSKLFIIADQISLTDTIQIVQIIKIIHDTLKLTEKILAHKELVIQDQIKLLDVITIIGLITKILKLILIEFLPIKISSQCFKPVAITSETLSLVNISTEEVVE